MKSTTIITNWRIEIHTLQIPHGRINLEQTTERASMERWRKNRIREETGVSGDGLPGSPGHEDLLRLLGEGASRARRGVGRVLRRRL